ncbi:lipoprotein signal peptidase [Aureimonas sp. SA4125]|uniref:signal peptidase II n=1 Tax=Aureimonas sp. SA4125 TaxID=2826993 RepID=UPI001CC5EB2F|nr:signal peptidase II [Aureimonas sp. SA4125]BDA87055.1 lipoprotein signal peptidase [Aureimonas sp. SA4125]
MNPRIVAALVILLTVVADQAIKAVVVATMELGGAIEILPFLALYHARNEGIAFSMFAGSADLALALMAVVVLAFVFWLWWKTPADRRLTHFAFAIIVGGAIGNLIDRVRLGYVTDYVLFHTPVWSFAVFNLADACISVGAVVIVADELLLGRREKKAVGPENSGSGTD